MCTAVLELVAADVMATLFFVVALVVYIVVVVARLT